MTTREIVEAANQRNTSAVTYHFGSRQGLLLEVLARRGGPVDAERGALRAALDQRPEVTELVRCLVAPYAALLDHAEGRAYVRIVAQLRGRFAAWRVESDAETTKHLATILDELEARPRGPIAVRRGRVVALIMLLTASVAERSRSLEEAAPLDLGPDRYVDDLVVMCAALVTA